MINSRSLPLLRAVAGGVVLLAGVAGDALAQRRGADSTRGATESEYYRMSTVPIPEGVVLEVGGLETMPDGRLAVATRRGDVWLIENPGSMNAGRPHFTRFAQGLHEALGLSYRDNALYTTQRGELTRLRDTDGDGRADRYETVSSWPLSGNYHEYSFGPVFSPKGDMMVTLNLAWVGYGESFVKWRGWMLSVGPDGKATPFATGFRSPSSFGYNMEGDLFYTENQGDWVGSGHLTHVEKGDFVGNPKGLKWSGEPDSPVKLTSNDIPNTGEPKFDVAKRVPKLKTPAVWFPHAIMGISTSAVLVDSTRGAFGPFAGQLFVGDQGHSKIMRVSLEKVNGVYQGAVFPFREGFASGVFRQVWGTDGSMYVGQTSRGWGATGRAPYGLQRLVWTGKVPFEPHRIEARPDGFEITFTMPVDRTAAADPASYKVSSFTYKYHNIYGSPPINQLGHGIRDVVVSRDGRSARIVVDSLRQGYIHEIRMAGVKSEAGAPLLHDFGYYTMNEIPGGAKLAVRSAPRRPAPAASTVATNAPNRIPESTPPPANGAAATAANAPAANAANAPAVSAPSPNPPSSAATGTAAPTGAAASAAGATAPAAGSSAPAAATASAEAPNNGPSPVNPALRKRQTSMPAAWNGTVDQTVSVAGEDGLKFSLPAIDVKAGARVKLDFENVSDMLHNLVIVRPGTSTKVGEEALKLGLDGARLHYVPPSNDVLYFTAMLEPQKAETIYFQAPTTPGDYTYVCTLPGPLHHDGRYAARALRSAAGQRSDRVAARTAHARRAGRVIGRPFVVTLSLLRLALERGVLQALSSLGRLAVRLGGRVVQPTLHVAAGLLGGLADVAGHLVETARVLALRGLDAGGLLEHRLGLVAGVGQAVVRLARATANFRLRIAACLLGRLADIVSDLVEAARLVGIGFLRFLGAGGRAVKRECSGDGRDANVVSHR